jgi:opacity protein-like surface antigen
MKHMRYAVILVALVAPVLSAQVVLPERKGETDLRENVFGLGVAGGAASGTGLSFRHHLPTAWSYQITGGIIKVKDRLSSAIGAELQYDLVRSAIHRFFVGGGLGHYYSGRSSGNELEAPARVGLGIGGEFVVAPGLHTLTELWFTYFSDGTILPLPQIGFYYYFY